MNIRETCRLYFNTEILFDPTYSEFVCNGTPKTVALINALSKPVRYAFGGRTALVNWVPSHDIYRPDLVAYKHAASFDETSRPLVVLAAIVSIVAVPLLTLAHLTSFVTGARAYIAQAHAAIRKFEKLPSALSTDELRPSQPAAPAEPQPRVEPPSDFSGDRKSSGPAAAAAAAAENRKALGEDLTVAQKQAVSDGHVPFTIPPKSGAPLEQSWKQFKQSISVDPSKSTPKQAISLWTGGNERELNIFADLLRDAYYEMKEWLLEIEQETRDPSEIAARLKEKIAKAPCITESIRENVPLILPNLYALVRRYALLVTFTSGDTIPRTQSLVANDRDYSLRFFHARTAYQSQNGVQTRYACRLYYNRFCELIKHHKLSEFFPGWTPDLDPQRLPEFYTTPTPAGVGK